MNLKDLLYDVLPLVNQGTDSEDPNKRLYIANLNLSAPK